MNTNLDWVVDDETVFPEGFFDIGLRTFKYVFLNKKEFVDFIILVTNPTGIFEAFQKYCKHKM